MQNILKDQKIVLLWLCTWNLLSCNQYVYQKNINYVSGKLSGLSRVVMCFFPSTFLEIAA